MAYPLSVAVKRGANPNWFWGGTFWAGGGGAVLEYPLELICMFLDWKRNPEHKEETHKGRGRTYKPAAPLCHLQAGMCEEKKCAVMYVWQLKPSFVFRFFYFNEPVSLFPFNPLACWLQKSHYPMSRSPDWKKKFLEVEVKTGISPVFHPSREGILWPVRSWHHCLEIHAKESENNGTWSLHPDTQTLQP